MGYRLIERIKQRPNSRIDWVVIGTEVACGVAPAEGLLYEVEVDKDTNHIYSIEYKGTKAILPGERLVIRKYITALYESGTL